MLGRSSPRHAAAQALVLALSVLLCASARAQAPRKDELPTLRDGAYHYLQEGESLWSIARTYDVPLGALMERNGITSDDQVGQLRAGKPIIVPGIKPSDVTHKKPKARSGITHELAKGETLWDLAKTYRVSMRELLSANRLTEEDASKLRDGKRLFIPGVEHSKTGRVERAPTKSELQALSVARKLGLGTRSTASLLLHGRVEERWTRAAEQAGRWNGTLRWPVSLGWFVRGYGSGAGGYHKAMDIMGKMGWNVRASAPGIVGYSGDGIPGFGNMVMIVHPGGFVTMYAHNSVNFVRAGQRVQRNEVIAEVGSTGRSKGPHVHFELMYQGQNCDPAPLFRPGVKRRDGSLARIAYSTWRGKQRPAQLQCAKRMRHPHGASVLSEDPERDTSPEPLDNSAPDPAHAPPSDEPE